MTNKQKSDLRLQVRHLLQEGKTEGIIISRLIRQGFKKATIKKHIKSLSII